MQCGILEGALEQKRDVTENLVKSEYSVELTVLVWTNAPW
jgi:hypothetical protein